MDEESRYLLDVASSVFSSTGYRNWHLRCDECVRHLRGVCRDSGCPLNVGKLNSAIVAIVRLERAKQELRRRFGYEGAGYSDSDECGGSGGSDGAEPRTFQWMVIETAFKNRVLTGAVLNIVHIEPREFLEDARGTIVDRVRDNLERHSCLKVNIVFNGEFVSNDKTDVMSIFTKNHQLGLASDLQHWYDARVIAVLLTKLEEFQARESGWALRRIVNLIVNVNKCNPMRAGCWISIPRDIQSKKALINVKSSDNACFAWAVVAALYPVDNNANRVTRYPHYSTVLTLEGIQFPMTLKQITLFERLNDVSVNVFVIREKNKGKKKEESTGGAVNTIVPLRLTKCKSSREGGRGHVNMLYLCDSRFDEKQKKKNIGHFVWIKNLPRLAGSQLTKGSRRKYICDRCLHYFSTSEKLSAHGVDCGEINDCAVLLPSDDDDDKLLYFCHGDRKERLPFVVYADLECLLTKSDERDTLRNSTIDQHHKAFSVGYYVRSAYEDDIASMYRYYRGESCISWFVRELNILAHRVKATLSRNVSMAELTYEESYRFLYSSLCHICNKPFKPGDLRARDHCHMTGRFRGPAHSSCNLNYKRSYVIPVFFHNLTGYDAHFIIRDVANSFEGKINLLPLTKERYISFTKDVKKTSCDMYDCSVKLRFVDSFKFLSASLERLTSYSDKGELKILRKEFSHVNDEDFDLLTRKGVFPYEYVDHLDKLLETRLPPREAFYSSLTGKTASDSDYEHASKVWRSFRIENLGEYSDLYLKTDVLLLADVFENFRNACCASYTLDPAHYYTLPGFTWDAMLKHTGIRFDLLTDIDMVLFVERGVRGGLSQCSHRYARANNKYMASHDASQPSTFLMYYDVNNLYGWAMCEPLPYAEFKWVDDAENFDVLSVSRESGTGYILEVDIAYPRELHDAHADLPFCSGRAKPPGKRNDKLLATLYDKERYVIHYRNLQQCMRHGLRLLRIHRVLQFAQSRWLSGYVELNTELRIRASNEFERELYKLMNNAVFGKTLENVRDRVDVRLVSRWDGRYGAETLIAKPNFHSRSIFSEDLMAVELRRLEIKFNKPIYVGMSILDISKTRLYDFHYDYMIPSYSREGCKILYMDTDSLVYSLRCEDAYEVMKRDIVRFDTSDYPEDNVYNLPRANKKIPGLMKDENKGAIMTEFVGLRAKMYAMRVTGRKETKKIKGIKKNIVARTILFDDYVRCLRDASEVSRRQSSIRSALHEVYTVSESKLALSPHDDKRYVESDCVSTLPWGHYRILDEKKRSDISPRRGLEPRSFARQANILPTVLSRK